MRGNKGGSKALAAVEAARWSSYAHDDEQTRSPTKQHGYSANRARINMTPENQLAAAEKVANREPEEADEETCNHDWRNLGTAKDGTQFFKCRNCPKEAES